MNSTLLVTGSVVAVLAALLHLVIFYFESVAWGTPAIWKRFGVRTQDDADTIKPMALNQGYYNLFLAVGALVGVALLLWSDVQVAGYAVALFALFSMVAAAGVLIVSNPRLARAAFTQGTLPLVASVLLLVAAYL